MTLFTIDAKVKSERNTMDKDVEKLAKELCEICCYPAPNPWDEEDRGVWRIRAEILMDKGYRRQWHKCDRPECETCNGEGAGEFWNKQEGLVALDEESLFELISVFNTRNPDRFYDPKAMKEDRQLAHDIYAKFGTKELDEEKIKKIISSLEVIKTLRQGYLSQTHNDKKIDLWVADDIDTIVKALAPRMTK